MAARRGWSRGTLLLVAALSVSGCYLEVAATYYPVIDGGDRVESSGWGFAANLGWGLKYRRVRAHLGRGYEAATTGYEDATGTGSVAHVSRWTAGIDTELWRLSRRWWGDLSLGGTWGQGKASVEYDEGVVANAALANPSVIASTWSAYAGPSFHYDRQLQYDLLLTAAPIVLHSETEAFDPFTAYGATIRFTYQLGLDPPDMNWGGGFTTLFRRGYDEEEANRQFEEDQRRFHERQGDLQRQERERQERERKEKQRCEQQGGC